MRLHVLLFLLFATPWFVHAEPLELTLIEGQKTIEPVIFSEINKKNIDAPGNVGLSWSYTVSCVVPSTSVNVNQVLECTQSAKSLSIKLIDNRVGEGAITIRAIGRDNADAIKQDILINIDIKVIEQIVDSARECAEWVTCKVYNGFYMGIDGTSANNLNESTTLRIQYSAYMESHKYVHLYGDILQTTQQEQTEVDLNCANDCESEPTIVGSIGTFFPSNEIFNRPITSSSLLFGPMAEFNIRKLENSDEFAKSYYAGIRFGLSKVRYFGIGYGKAEGVPGHRFKFTGQLPLYNGKVLAGINLNFSADDDAEDAGVSSGDSINISLVTQVDFTKIFTNWSTE